MKEIATLVDENEMKQLKELIRVKMKHLDPEDKAAAYEMKLKVLSQVRKSLALRVSQIEEIFSLEIE